MMDTETLLLAMFHLAENADQDPEATHAAMEWLAENAESEELNHHDHESPE